MSRFQQELDLVPRTAWVIAVCVWLAFFSIMMAFPFHMDPEGRNWPLAGKLAMSVLPGLPLFMLTLLIGYVHADAKRRGMRYVMWTWLAILIPNAIGIILYFVLRDPLLTPCARCAFQARPGFAFCPQCGAALSMACPKCRHAVEPGWSHCAHCGAALTVGGGLTGA
jgi:double zinc ribbon protein